MFAQYENKGNTKILFINGDRYYKNAESGDNTYWRCGKYQKYRCLARAITRMIDGYDMVKIKGCHTHI